MESEYDQYDYFDCLKYANENGCSWICLDVFCEDIKTDVEDEQCVICTINKKRIKYNPCNHYVCCCSCDIKLKSQDYQYRCPMCRSNIMLAEIVP